MKMPIALLDLALLAAVVVLAVIGWRWSRPKSAVAEYEEFNEFPAVTKCVLVYQNPRAICKGAMEIIKSIHKAAELKITLQGGVDQLTTLGRYCYVSDSRKYSVFTGELTASIANEESKNCSNVCNDNTDAITPYEQSQIKNCLA